MANQIRQYEIRDFSGGLFRPSARHLSALQIPENASPNTKNMWARSLGLEKRSVTKSWNDTPFEGPAKQLMGLCVYKLSNGSRFHIAFTQHSIYQQEVFEDRPLYGASTWMRIDGYFNHFTSQPVETAVYHDTLIFTYESSLNKYTFTGITISGITPNDSSFDLNGLYIYIGTSRNNRPEYIHNEDTAKDYRRCISWNSDGAGYWVLGLSTTDFGVRFYGEAYINQSDNVCETYINNQEYPDYTGDGVAVWQKEITPLGENTPEGRYLLIRDNRLFVAGNNMAPSRLYFSERGLPEAWSANNFIDVNDSDGDRITGLAEYAGNIYIFKHNSIYRLSGTEPTDFYLSRVVSDIGAVSQRSIVSTSSGLFFTSYGGVYQFDGSSTPQCISVQIGSYFHEGKISTSSMERTACAWFKDALFVSIPTEDLYLTNVFVYDALTQSWWQWETNQDDEQPLLAPTVFMVSVDTDRAPALYFDAPIMYEGRQTGSEVCSFLTSGTYDAGHLTFASYWTSKDFDFGNPSLYKRFRRLRITGSSLQDRTFNIYFAVDGKQEFTLARTVNLYKASNNITQAKINLPMSARGKTIRLKVESAEDQELRIESIIIEYQEVGIR